MRTESEFHPCKKCPGLRRRMTAAMTGMGAAALCLLASCTPFGKLPPPQENSLADGAGRLVVRKGLAVADVKGPPAGLGARQGQLLGAQMRPLLQLVSLSPQFRMSPTTVAALAADVPPAYRAEMDAMAKAAGIDPQRLLAANLSLDTLCTALAAGADGAGPVRVARNMDFFPAELLGPATVVLLRRPEGRHAFVSVGWPGYAGVITGMNDAGLTTAILQNYGNAGPRRKGTPVAFRARELLENCDSAATAAERFAAAPVASSHFIFLADARTACVVWQDAAGTFHRRNAGGGWLAWSNGKPDDRDRQHDDRAVRLAQAVAALPPTEPVSDLWLKQTLAGVRLKTINAQAMLLVPGERRLELACARGWTSAGRSPWLRLDLAPCLQPGGTLDALKTTAVGKLPPTGK